MYFRDGGSNNKATSGNSGHLTLSYSCCRIKYSLDGEKCIIHTLLYPSTNLTWQVLGKKNKLMVFPALNCANYS